MLGITEDLKVFIHSDLTCRTDSVASLCEGAITATENMKYYSTPNFPNNFAP